MAELPTESITKLEGLLKGLGYDLAGHETGKADAALNKAVTDAMTKVQGMFDISDAIDTPKFRSSLLKEVDEFKKETTFGMNNYEQFKIDAADGVIGTGSPLSGNILSAVKDRGMPQQFIDNPNGVIDFVDHASSYVNLYGDYITSQKDPNSSEPKNADPEEPAEPSPEPTPTNPSEPPEENQADPVPEPTETKPVEAEEKPADPGEDQKPEEEVEAEQPAQVDKTAEVEAALLEAARRSAIGIRTFQGRIPYQPQNGALIDDATIGILVSSIASYQALLGEEITGQYTEGLAERISELGLDPRLSNPAAMEAYIQRKAPEIQAMHPNKTPEEKQALLIKAFQSEAHAFANGLLSLKNPDHGFLDAVNDLVALKGQDFFAAQAPQKPQTVTVPGAPNPPGRPTAPVSPAELAQRQSSIKFLEDFLKLVGPEVDKANPTGAKVTMPDAVVGFLNKFFPTLIPMIDGFLKDFTGGNGIADFLPDTGDFAALKTQLSGMTDTPEDRMKSQFKKVFGEVDENGDLKIDRAEADKLQAGMVKAVRGLSFLPFGDPNYRAEYPNAVDRACTEALDKLHSGEMNPDQAAEHFATRFIALMEPYRPNGVNYQERMRYVREDANGNPVLDAKGNAILDDFKIDPLLADRMAKLRFDPDLDGNISAADIMDNIKTLEQAYYDVNYDIYGRTDKALADQEPLIFKGQDGNIYIAGITGDKDNIFTIYEMPVDLMKQKYSPDMTDAELDALYKVSPGLEMVMRNYPNLLRDKDGPGRNGVEVFLNKLKNAQSYDRLLEDVKDDRNKRLLAEDSGAPVEIFADYGMVRDRLAMQMYFSWRDALVNSPKGKSAAALSKHGISPEKFKRALDQYIDDPSSDCGGAKFKKAIMSVKGSDKYKMYRASIDSDYASGLLAKKPLTFKYDAGKSYTGYDIEYYMHVGPGDSNCFIDVGAELGDYARLSPQEKKDLVSAANMSQSKRATLPSDLDIVRRFPALTEVARRYAAKHDGQDDKYDNAFEVADEIIEKQPQLQALQKAARKDADRPEPNPDQDPKDIPKAIPVTRPIP